jgi:hypothetical protein
LIRPEGIEGDYAFKNRLGMFVALSSCKIKFEKLQQAISVNPQSNELKR